MSKLKTPALVIRRWPFEPKLGSSALGDAAAAEPGDSGDDGRDSEHYRRGTHHAGRLARFQEIVRRAWDFGRRRFLPLRRWRRPPGWGVPERLPGDARAASRRRPAGVSHEDCQADTSG